MRTAKYFLFGVLYGLFLKWVFDQVYRNNHPTRTLAVDLILKDEIELFDEPVIVESKPAPQKATRAATKPASRKDDLKKIKGVGPAMEKKLNAAGIHTFDQFTRLSVKELQAIVGTSKRIAENANDMIAQAKKLKKG